MTFAAPLVLLACAPTENPPEREEVDPLTFAVDAPGPYNVGLQTWTVTYAPTPDETRTIDVFAWYPTEASNGDALDYLSFVPATDMLGNAPPIVPPYGNGFPVLVYSHGDQGWGGTSADLMAWMASHGWVGIAPNHTENTLADNVDPPVPGHWYHRALDLRASFDSAAERLSIETEQYVVAGHSRGVATMWAVAGATFDPEQGDTTCPGCTSVQRAALDSVADDRIVAGLGLAGTIRRSQFGEAGHRTVSVPIASMTGTEDSVGQQAQWEDMDTVDFTWWEVEGGCHQTFALGVCSTLDPEEGFILVNSWILAFSRLHRFGDETMRGRVEGTAATDPRVTILRK